MELESREQKLWQDICIYYREFGTIMKPLLIGIFFGFWTYFLNENVLNMSIGAILFVNIWEKISGFFSSASSILSFRMEKSSFFHSMGFTILFIFLLDFLTFNRFCLSANISSSLSSERSVRLFLEDTVIGFFHSVCWQKVSQSFVQERFFQDPEY